MNGKYDIIDCAQPEKSKSDQERVVMRDIDKLCKVFDDLNIEYAIKNDGEYQYLFIGERRDIHAMSSGDFETWEAGELVVFLLLLFFYIDLTEQKHERGER